MTGMHRNCIGFESNVIVFHPHSKQQTFTESTSPFPPNYLLSISSMYGYNIKFDSNSLHEKSPVQKRLLQKEQNHLQHPLEQKEQQNREGQQLRQNQLPQLRTEQQAATQSNHQQTKQLAEDDTSLLVVTALAAREGTSFAKTEL